MGPDIEEFHSTKEMLGYVLQNFSKKKVISQNFRKLYNLEFLIILSFM